MDSTSQSYINLSPKFVQVKKDIISQIGKILNYITCYSKSQNSYHILNIVYYKKTILYETLENYLPVNSQQNIQEICYQLTQVKDRLVQNYGKIESFIDNYEVGCVESNIGCAKQILDINNNLKIIIKTLVSLKVVDNSQQKFYTIDEDLNKVYIPEYLERIDRLYTQASQNKDQQTTFKKLEKSIKSDLAEIVVRHEYTDKIKDIAMEIDRIFKNFCHVHKELSGQNIETEQNKIKFKKYLSDNNRLVAQTNLNSFFETVYSNLQERDYFFNEYQIDQVAIQDKTLILQVMECPQSNPQIQKGMVLQLQRNKLVVGDNEKDIPQQLIKFGRYDKHFENNIHLDDPNKQNSRNQFRISYSQFKGQQITCSSFTNPTYFTKATKQLLEKDVMFDIAFSSTLFVEDISQEESTIKAEEDECETKAIQNAFISRRQIVGRRNQDNNDDNKNKNNDNNNNQSGDNNTTDQTHKFIIGKKIQREEKERQVQQAQKIQQLSSIKTQPQQQKPKKNCKITIAVDGSQFNMRDLDQDTLAFTFSTDQLWNKKQNLEILIGSGEQCDIQFLDTQGVVREVCAKIQYTDGFWFLQNTDKPEDCRIAIKNYQQFLNKEASNLLTLEKGMNIYTPGYQFKVL